MGNSAELIQWLAVVCVYFGLPFLLVGPSPIRKAAIDLLVRLGSWVTIRFEPDETPEEQYARELWTAVHQEWLRTNLDRLRWLVSHDEHMSATRQLANRLAYHQLCKEVATLEEAEPWLSVPAQTVDTAERGAAVISRFPVGRSWEAWSRGIAEPPRTVEILDFRWR
jgi:hypothetical protein